MKTQIRSRGGALIEFLMVFPLLLFTCFSLVDLTYAMREIAIATDAAREGARIGAAMAGFLDEHPLYRSRSMDNYRFRTGQFQGGALSPGSWPTVYSCRADEIEKRDDDPDAFKYGAMDNPIIRSAVQAACKYFFYEVQSYEKAKTNNPTAVATQRQNKWGVSAYVYTLPRPGSATEVYSLLQVTVHQMKQPGGAAEPLGISGVGSFTVGSLLLKFSLGSEIKRSAVFALEGI